MQTTHVHQTAEWTFVSRAKRDDPFGEIRLDVTFTHEDGRTWRIPAFWGGDDLWKVRFASPIEGVVHGTTICSDTSDAGLHDQRVSLRVLPYDGDNLLYRHGPIAIAPDQRHFQHADGTPFFWLGDTQWMSLSNRIKWPGEFQTLQLDRLHKGFTVVQLVAGPMCDMAPLDPQGDNEGGAPWLAGFESINPKCFDYADRRIAYLVDIGIVPCILGMWGFLAKFMSLEQVKQHWDYLVARYASYPVVFCLAGEATTSYYLDPEADYWDQYIKGWRTNTVKHRAFWTPAAQYLKKIEPYGRLLTGHPCNFNDPQCSARTMLDADVFDFDMLQTHHGPTIEQGWLAVQSTAESLKLEPNKPVIQAEGFYESILEGSREECQRFYFWSSMLCGCAGHTYGANGIWQLNQDGAPFRANPRKLHWGDRPWRDAMNLRGGIEVGIGRRILEQFDWWKFQPHPEWVEVTDLAPDADATARRKHAALRPYAAGITGKVRLIYLATNWTLTPLKQVARLERGGHEATWINPSTGEQTPIGEIQPDANGNWSPPMPPSMRDWLLCMVKT